jgi:hypothetical protein
MSCNQQAHSWTASSRQRQGQPPSLYDVPNSSWTSPQWNWGYAQGTGHDCAAICRRKFSTCQARSDFVDRLLQTTPSTLQGTAPDKTEGIFNFEEVKLVLALAWQRGRWDGSDGGPGGYGEILSALAEASRYEDGLAVDIYKRWLLDMSDPQRYNLLRPTPHQAQLMQSIRECSSADDLESACLQCSGLVLQTMGFVERGL